MPPSQPPAELRETIFEYSVASEDHILFEFRRGKQAYQKILPPLTRTNRQIRAESLPIFFKHNHFRFDSWLHWDHLEKAILRPWVQLDAHVYRLQLIELPTCWRGCIWLLDLSKGLRKYKLTVQTFGKKRRGRGKEKVACCVEENLVRATELLSKITEEVADEREGLNGAQLRELLEVWYHEPSRWLPFL